MCVSVSVCVCACVRVCGCDETNSKKQQQKMTVAKCKINLPETECSRVAIDDGLAFTKVQVLANRLSL